MANVKCVPRALEQFFFPLASPIFYFQLLSLTIGRHMLARKERCNKRSSGTAIDSSGRAAFQDPWLASQGPVAIISQGQRGLPLTRADNQLWDGLVLGLPAPRPGPLPRSGLWQQHWGQQHLSTGLWEPEPGFERRSGRCWGGPVQASGNPPNPGETGTSYGRHREVLVPLRVPVRCHISSHRHGRHRGDFYVQHVAPDQGGIGGPAVCRRRDADRGGRVLEGPQTEEEEEEGRWIFFHWAGNLVRVVDLLKEAQAQTCWHHLRLYREENTNESQNASGFLCSWRKWPGLSVRSFPRLHQEFCSRLQKCMLQCMQLRVAPSAWRQWNAWLALALLALLPLPIGWTGWARA